MLASAPAPEAVEPPQTQTQDSAPITQESAPEPVIVQVPDASHGEAQEMPSPTSDEETGGAGERERERGPVVSPSSSTAPQAETHPITSMLEREEVSGAPGTPPPAVDEEGNKAEAEVEADEPVAEVAESVDQIGGKEGEGEKKEEEVQAQDISEGTKGVTDSEPSAAAEETSAPAKPVSEPEPAPVAATEELDVTETQKDAAEPAKPEAELEAGKAE
ncbi:hypothetical protein R3P38DRAFT_2874335 [Favolaschia claudopus]|uniref:Uncharacterized protein n=1 Tax=Favolaschia claudopus TaxID=2862362 RepID=A0AAW0D220_9AGAR